MDLGTLYTRTVESWTDRVRDVAPDQWDRPTPCREWSVRDLTNHVVGEDLWTAPLMEGRTIASPARMASKKSTWRTIAY